MAQSRHSELVHGTDVTLEVYVDGAGHPAMAGPSARRRVKCKNLFIK
jgi:hypothetical protein